MEKNQKEKLNRKEFLNMIKKEISFWELKEIDLKI